MKFLLCVCAATLLLLAVPVYAHPRGMESNQFSAERRVALVIGNNEYERSPLLNPINDAKDMAQALREAQFEVLQKNNLTLKEMRNAVREFAAQMRSGGVGLFYFAGHAVQVGARNYLIPIDARLRNESDLADGAVDISQVLAQMQVVRNGVNIMILDACRNNPFPSKNQAVKNFAPIEAPPGTLIAFATAPGALAWDGRGRNSIYTRELVRAMRTKGLSIEEVFKTVRLGVQRQSLGRQTPWETSSLTSEFYFSPTDEKWLEGYWEGLLYQSPTQAGLPIKLLAQNNQFSVEYPAQTCSGELTLVQRKHSNATFRERLTNGRGRCEEGGEILLEKINNSQIVYKYFSPSVNDFVASAILNRKEFKAQAQPIMP